MECKDKIKALQTFVRVVLIETLWNVKTEARHLEKELASGINRNIVECKVGKNVAAFYHTHVLIETLWNVKFFYSAVYGGDIEY